MGKAKHRAISSSGWSKAGSDPFEAPDSPKILAGKNIKVVTKTSGLKSPAPDAPFDLAAQQGNPNYNVFDALTDTAEAGGSSEESQSDAEDEVAGQPDTASVSSQAAAVPEIFQERSFKATVAIAGAYSAHNDDEDDREPAWLSVITSSEVVPLATGGYTGYKALLQHSKPVWQAQGTTVTVTGAYRAPSRPYSAPDTAPIWLQILSDPATTMTNNPITISAPAAFPDEASFATQPQGQPLQPLLPGVHLTSLPQLGGDLSVMPALAYLPIDGTTVAKAQAGPQNGTHNSPTQSPFSPGQTIPTTQADTMAANGASTVSHTLSTAAQQLLQTTDASKADGNGLLLMPEALPGMTGTIPATGSHLASTAMNINPVQLHAGSRLVGAVSTGLDLGAGLAYYTAGATCGTVQGLASAGGNLAGYTVGAAFNTAQAAAVTGSHAAYTTVGAACNTVKAVAHGGGHLAYHTTGAACGVAQALTSIGGNVLGQTSGLLSKKKADVGSDRTSAAKGPLKAAPSPAKPQKEIGRLGKLVGSGFDKGASVAYWGTGMACGVLMGLAQGVRKPLS